MSKQTGIIKLDGTIGGIAFYQSGGQHLARVAKGPSKQQIATQPNFIRTRENNAEFGGAAHAAKSMRSALATSIQSMGDARIASRLTKVFREICAKDIAGVRGQRAIELSTYRNTLLGFEFNKGESFGSVFSAPFTHSYTAGRDEASINIAAFIPSFYIHAPSGATHFRVIQAIGVVSDFAYSAALGSYEPINTDVSDLGAVSASAVTALSSSAPVTLSLSATLAGSPTLRTDVSVLQCLGIVFYQRIGTTDYPLAQGNAMRIVDVF